MNWRIQVSNITHPEMVSKLAKCGEKIIDELSPLSAHLLHMATGIAGEAGELCEAIYNCHSFESIDAENVVEELGDLEFYIEGLRQGLQLNRDKTIPMSQVKRDYHGSLIDAKDAAVMLNIETSILLDYVKKSAFYVKPIKFESVLKSLTAINVFMCILRECFRLSYEDTLRHNVAKLGERYQGHNYSNEQAINRADKA